MKRCQYISKLVAGGFAVVLFSTLLVGLPGEAHAATVSKSGTISSTYTYGRMNYTQLSYGNRLNYYDLYGRTKSNSIRAWRRNYMKARLGTTVFHESGVSAERTNPTYERAFRVYYTLTGSTLNTTYSTRQYCHQSQIDAGTCVSWNSSATIWS
jgi:hypothetical protein